MASSPSRSGAATGPTRGSRITPTPVRPSSPGPPRPGICSAARASLPSMRVAIVGATGAVGTIMRRLARERFADAELVAFASERSAGKELDDGMVVQPLTEEGVLGFDLALLSA